MKRRLGAATLSTAPKLSTNRNKRKLKTTFIPVCRLLLYQRRLKVSMFANEYFDRHSRTAAQSNETDTGVRILLGVISARKTPPACRLGFPLRVPPTCLPLRLPLQVLSDCERLNFGHGDEIGHILQMLNQDERRIRFCLRLQVGAFSQFFERRMWHWSRLFAL